MNKSEKRGRQERHSSFIKYCKEYQIDMNILSCRWLNLHQLWSYINIVHNDDNIYITLLSEDENHTYIFKFKDEQPIHTFFKLLSIEARNDYSCNYMENNIKLRRHNLKYIMLNDVFGKTFYTFDADTNHILIKIYVDGTILLHNDLYEIINTKPKQIEYDKSWNYITEQKLIPRSVRKLITTQQVLLALL